MASNNIFDKIIKELEQNQGKMRDILYKSINEDEKLEITKNLLNEEDKLIQFLLQSVKYNLISDKSFFDSVSKSEQYLALGQAKNKQLIAK